MVLCVWFCRPIGYKWYCVGCVGRWVICVDSVGRQVIYGIACWFCRPIGYIWYCVSVGSVG